VRRDLSWSSGITRVTWPKNWVFPICAASLAPSSDGDGAVGGGAAVAFDGPIPLYARLLLRLLILSFRMNRLAAGCFVFCTRSTFLAVGGFNEAYYCAEEVVLSRALGRLGRFVVLQESVTTSARKFRTYSTRELLTSMFRIAVRGPKAMQCREGLELWYGERRNDPPDA